MPLRDHFHPPLDEELSWEPFHSAWINTIVRHLNGGLLPERYRAQPQAHLGGQVEVDVGTFQKSRPAPAAAPGNGTATAVWAPAKPTRTLAIEFSDQDVFEVRVQDRRRASRLVAAIELVSPANKDRPASRRAFAIKCASYLQQNVSVVIVDVVTERHDDLYAELLELLRQESTPGWAGEPPLYAVACRTFKEGEIWQMDAWTEPLHLGGVLPTLPLWLASDLALPLELEASYEETLDVLRLL